jgi:predicted RNase H-like HicB family nuclease
MNWLRASLNQLPEIDSNFRRRVKNERCKERRDGKIKVNTFVFKVELEQDEDGRWGAEIPALPGCATWGYAREETLEALKEAAQAYLEVLKEKGGTSFPVFGYN